MYTAYKQNQNPATAGDVPAPVPTVVTVEWLKENLNSDDIRIIDGTFHIGDRDAKAEYEEKHIPGAVFFDIDECADTTSEYKMPHMLPRPEVFEEYVGSRGINNSCHVIVYDNNANVPVFSAQRVWWTFYCFGYTRVSVLEGGLGKWIAAEGPVTNELSKPKPEIFKANFQPALVKAYDEIVKNIESKEFQLVDARPPGRFQGTAPEPIPDVKPGHIPGAVNLPFGKLMDMEKKTYKSAEELAKVFKDHNVDLSKPVIFTCGSGLQASNLAMAAYICGNRDAALYDGSWVEWFRRAPGDMKENVPGDQ